MDPKHLHGPFPSREAEPQDADIHFLDPHIDITPGSANQEHALSHLASCGFDNPMASGPVGNFCWPTDDYFASFRSPYS